MKISDDYKAKFRLWAANPQVIPASAPAKIPHFKSKRFASHSEMNAWKDSLLRQLAQSVPAK
jgi:isopenicillin N synthase-like dioxygenase